MNKYTFYQYFIIVVIFILIIEVYKCAGKEYFSTAPTDYMLQKEGAETKFMSEDEEIQVGEQTARGVRKMYFDKIKNTTNKYVAVYAKKEDSVIRYFIVSVKESSLAEIFGVNGILVNEDGFEVKYFIKVLTKESYEKGMVLQKKILEEKSKYSACIATNSLVMPRISAVEKCKKEINVVPT